MIGGIEDLHEDILGLIGDLPLDFAIDFLRGIADELECLDPIPAPPPARPFLRLLPGGLSTTTGAAS